MIVVRFHHYDGDPIDATRYVTAASFGYSVDAPWEWIDLTLSVPLSELERVFPGGVLGRDGGGRAYYLPSPSFVVVLEGAATFGSAALVWGFPDQIRAMIKVAPETGAPRVQVQLRAVSWFARMGRARIVVSGVTHTGFPPGTYYDVETWGRFLDPYLGDLAQATGPGAALAGIWPALGTLELPASLGGGRLGDEIPVVWDRETCATWAPLRLPQQERVPGIAISALASVLPRGSVLQWVQGSFAVEPRLIELFPTLDFPSYRDPVGGVLAEDSAFDVRAAAARVLSPSALGRALGGAQPVLLYRWRPFSLAPINSSTAAAVRARKGGGPVGVPAAERLAALTGASTTYGQDPVGLEDCARTQWGTFAADEIHALTVSWQDQDRVNGVYVKTPVAPGGDLFHGAVGEPVLDALDVRRHGLRMIDLEFPFLTPDQYIADTGGPSYQEIATALVDRGFHIAACSDTVFYGRAEVSTAYRPWLRQGVWVDLELPAADLYTESVGLEVRDRHSPRPSTNGATGYARQVVHRVQVDQTTGKITALGTTITLERLALFGPGQYPFPFPLRGGTP
jgi:hypothetical protein